MKRNQDHTKTYKTTHSDDWKLVVAAGISIAIDSASLGSKRLILPVLVELSASAFRIFLHLSPGLLAGPEGGAITAVGALWREARMRWGSMLKISKIDHSLLRILKLWKEITTVFNPCAKYTLYGGDYKGMIIAFGMLDFDFLWVTVTGESTRLPFTPATLFKRAVAGRAFDSELGLGFIEAKLLFGAPSFPLGFFWSFKKHLSLLVVLAKSSQNLKHPNSSRCHSR